MTTSSSALHRALLANLRLTFDGDEAHDWQGGLLFAVRGLDARAASRRLRAGGPTIAGQVEHVRFSLHEVTARLRGERHTVDWALGWAVAEVDTATWDRLRDGLQQAYAGCLSLIGARDDWDAEALEALPTQIAHTASHAGAVRQMVRALG